MNLIRPVAALLLLCLLALPGRAAPEAPDWAGPFELNGLTLMMKVGDLDSRLGPATKEFDGDLRVYPGNLLVRVREGLVVNLSAADQTGSSWALQQEGREVARTGLTEADLLSRFGEPSESYLKKGVLKAMVFSGDQVDVGVMALDGRVVGLMLAERGMLSPSLMDSGYAPVRQAPAGP